MIRRLAARVAVSLTKIHLKTDFGGLPIAFHLTGGEASDSRNFETLLDIGPDLNPRAALGDNGYNSKSNRDAADRTVPIIKSAGVLHFGSELRHSSRVTVSPEELDKSNRTSLNRICDCRAATKQEKATMAKHRTATTYLSQVYRLERYWTK